LEDHENDGHSEATGLTCEAKKKTMPVTVVVLSRWTLLFLA